MPEYDYECECGNIVTRACKMGSAPAKVKCDKCGKRAPRKWRAPAARCVYSLFERNAGNPRVNRGKGRR